MGVQHTLTELQAAEGYGLNGDCEPCRVYVA